MNSQRKLYLANRRPGGLCGPCPAPQKKAPDYEKIGLWQSLAFEIKKEYKDLVDSFEKDFPMFYRLKYDNSIITADSASALLQADLNARGAGV